MKKSLPIISKTNVCRELMRLLEPNVLGNYEWFEAIEIGYSDNDKTYHNIFTIYVANDLTPLGVNENFEFLSRESRKINGIKNKSFSIVKKYVKTETIINIVKNYDESGEWLPPSPSLNYNRLKVIPTAFYSPDGTEYVPLNELLKNNFWNGSHVIELADSEKSNLHFLTKNPKAFSFFSSWVREFIAIDFSSLPDRMGNVIIQIPVTSVAVGFSGYAQNLIGTKVAWHPDVPPRPITGTISVRFDQAIVAHGQKALNEGENSIVEDVSDRGYQGFVWDTEKNILLAANPITYFWGGNTSVETVVSRSLRTRVSNELDDKGNPIRNEIDIYSSNTNRTKRKSSRVNGEWTERRISDTAIKKLVKAKRFMQYGGLERGKKEHKRALHDIRELIDAHGKDSIYLWDPYLSAKDILSTLLHCKHHGSKLQALTSTSVTDLKKVRDKNKNIAKRIKWINDQREILSTNIEDNTSIDLEFRIGFGPKGWAFHDRFLIFPNTNNYPDTPQVWSLGASLNHLGMTHAIVQQIAHPQPVLDAFEDLWSRINSSEHIIWKSI